MFPFLSRCEGLRESAETRWEGLETDARRRRTFPVWRAMEAEAGCEITREMRLSSTTCSSSSSSSTWRRGPLAVKVHPAGYKLGLGAVSAQQGRCIPTRKFGTRINADDWRLLFLPHHEPRGSQLGGVRSAAASTGRPCTYRLDVRVTKDPAGYTLGELVRDGTSKALRTKVPL